VVSHKQVIESGLEVLQSIESLAEKIQLPVSMGDLKIRQIFADTSLSEKLRVIEGAELIEVKRVIRAEGRSVAFLVDILPEKVLISSDLEEGFTGSVLDLLLKRGAITLMNSFTEINAVAATSDIARLLEIQRGDVLLMFQAYLYDDAGRVVDFSQSYFLPGYFRFHVVRRVGLLSGAAKNND